MTRRRAWTSCGVAALLLFVGACARQVAGRSTLGTLSPSAPASSGPTPAPPPSNTTGPPTTGTGPGTGTGTGTGHTVTQTATITSDPDPSPDQGNSSFNIRQVQQDFSITLPRDPHTGQPMCQWADAGNGLNSVGVRVNVAHHGGNPLRQPTEMKIRIADDQGHHFDASVGFHQLLVNVSVGAHQAEFSLTLTVAAILTTPDIDPTNDQVSVSITVPVGVAPDLNFTPINCTVN